MYVYYSVCFGSAEFIAIEQLVVAVTVENTVVVMLEAAVFLLVIVTVPVAEVVTVLVYIALAQ